MVHKTPECDKWELAMRSRELWEMLADDIQRQCMDPLEILGWKKTGKFVFVVDNPRSTLLLLYFVGKLNSSLDQKI